jgi:predicted acyltransferase
LSSRFYSLDVFRGATVALMILVNNPGSWTNIYPPLKHAPWHGLTPTDLVFPFFLFAVGNAMAFVLPRLREGGDGAFWKKVIKRTILIFAIGLFLNWWPFFSWKEGELVFRHWVNPDNPESGVRILGVLQRIALCYFFAAILAYYLKPRQALAAGIILLLGYWLICYMGNPADPYSLQGWVGTEQVDKKILGTAHLYRGEGVAFDPEGLLSTLSAIVQVVIGFLVGYFIRQKGKTLEMLTALFVAGIALVLVGFAWDMVFPINKKIWTSSFTVYTSGLAILTISTMIYLIEFRQYKGALARFFDVFGKNALFVFALSAFLPKGLSLIRFGDGSNPWNWLYVHVYKFILPIDPRVGSLLFALTVIAFMWAVCYWMDRKKIYIKV